MVLNGLEIPSQLAPYVGTCLVGGCISEWPFWKKVKIPKNVIRGVAMEGILNFGTPYLFQGPVKLWTPNLAGGCNSELPL